MPAPGSAGDQSPAWSDHLDVICYGQAFTTKPGAGCAGTVNALWGSVKVRNALSLSLAAMQPAQDQQRSWPVDQRRHACRVLGTKCRPASPDHRLVATVSRIGASGSVDHIRRSRSSGLVPLPAPALRARRLTMWCWARAALGEPVAGCQDLEEALAKYRRTGPPAYSRTFWSSTPMQRGSQG